MLYTVNDDTNLFNDYFNLNNDYNMMYNNQNNMMNYNNSNNVLSPKQGLTLGNLYKDEYVGYKNYRPRELNATTEQGRELLKIRELCFAIIDLNLKLDIEPNNRELFRLYKSYNEELNERTKKYSEKYGAINQSYDSNEKYTWVDNPWPWEVDANV